MLFKNTGRISWEKYLFEKFSEAEIVIKKFGLPNFIKSCKNAILNKNLPNKTGFLIIDPNEENFFFNNDKIYALIDVDHPIGGELFYQWGLYAFLRPEQFEILKENRKFTSHQLYRIYNFALLHAYIDLYFRMQSVKDLISLKPWIQTSSEFINYYRRLNYDQ